MISDCITITYGVELTLTERLKGCTQYQFIVSMAEAKVVLNLDSIASCHNYFV